MSSNKKNQIDLTNVVTPDDLNLAPTAQDRQAAQKVDEKFAQITAPVQYADDQERQAAIERGQRLRNYLDREEAERDYQAQLNAATYRLRATNPTRDAFAPLPELDLQDPNSRIAYAVALNKRQRAQNLLSVSSWQIENNAEIKKEFNELTKSQSDPYMSDVSKINLQADFQEKLAKQYDEVINQYGGVSEDLLLDPNFRKYCTPAVLQSLLNAREDEEASNGKNGWFRSFMRAYDFEAERRRAAIDFKETGDKITYDKKINELSLKYERSYDGDTTKAVAGSLASMIQPVVDNPLKGSAVLASALIAGFITKNPAIFNKILGYGASAIIYPDEYEQFQADMLNTAMDMRREDFLKENPNATEEELRAFDAQLNREEFLKNTRGAAATSALLDLVGDRFMLRGVSTPLKAMFTDIQKKAVEAPLLAAAKATAKDWAADTAVNIATEGMQDAINTAAAANASGTGNALSKAMEAGEESLRAAIAPSAILTTVFSTPRLVHNLRTYTRDFQSKTITEERLASGEKLSDKLDQAGIPAENKAALYQKVFEEGDRNYSQMAFDPKQVMDTIDMLGLEGEQIPKQFRDRAVLQDMIDNGQEIELNRAEFYAFFSKEQREQFKNDFHFTDLGSKTLGVLSKDVSDIRADKIADDIQKEYSKENEQFKEDQYVAGQIQSRLTEQNIGNAESRSATAHLAASFFRAMGEMMDVSPREAMESYLYRFKRNDKVNTLNIAEDQADDFNKDIKGRTYADENKIEFSPDADIGTMLEEMSHSFLLTAARLERDGKANAQLSTALKAFKEWIGDPNIDLTELTEQNRYAHEGFATAFMQYLITGQADKSNVTALRAFKQLLSRVSSVRSIYQGLKPSDFKNDTNGSMRADVLGNRYEAQYGHKLNKLDEKFGALIDAMFGQQHKLMDENTRYSFSSIFEGADNPRVVLTAEDHAELKKSEQDLQNKLEESLMQADAVQNPVIFEGLSEAQMKRAALAKGKGKGSQIRKAAKITEEKLQTYEQLANELKKAGEEYKKGFTEYFKNSYIGKFYELLREVKINSNDPALKQLKPSELKALQDAGLLSEKGQFTAANIKNTFTGFSTRDPRGLAAQVLADRLNDDVSALSLLAHIPHESKLVDFFTDEMMRGERQKLKEQFTQADAGVYILDERLRQNAKEQKILNKAINSREEAGLCKDAARKLLARSPFGSINVSNLIDRAARVKKLAQEALRKGDLDLAGKYLRTERVLLEEAKLASRVKSELEARLKEHRAFLSKSDKQLSKRYDVKMLMLNRILMSQLGIKDMGLTPENFDMEYEANASNPDIKNFYDLIAGKTEAGAVLQGYYKDMTAQNVELAIRMMDSIQRISRKNGWLRNKGKYDIRVKDAQAKMFAALEKHKDRAEKYMSDGKGGGSPMQERTKGRTWREGFRDFNYSFYRPEPFFQMLDGQDTEGAWVKYVYTPIKNAEVHSMTEMAEWRKAIRDAREKLGLKFDTDLVIDCPELKFSDEMRAATGLDHFKFGVGNDTRGRNVAQQQILGLMMHMGNCDNFNKMLQGYFGKNVNEEQFIAWFNRMCDAGYITKEMMDFTQRIWDINKKYFDEVQKAHYETHGYEIKVIDPRMIHTRWGDYKGGVVRAISNDDVINDDTMKMNDVKDFANAVERDLPTIKNGFTQERKSGAIRALCIDPERLIQETRNMILYANFQPAFADVNRVLDPEMRAALEKKYPGIYDGFLKKWLATTIQQRTTTGSDDGIAKSLFSFIGYMTRMAGQALMVGNLNNTLQQISGFATLATKVPVSQIALSLCRSLGHWSEIRKEINASEFMRNRLINVNDGVQNVFDDMIFSSVNYKTDALRKSKLALKQANAWARQHSYFMQKFFQDYIDRVAYDAAYQHALKQGKTLEEAQRYGESVVRTTQSSFDVADMTNMEKSTALVKMFTQFGGYFYTMFRLQSSQISMICARENVSNVHKALSIAWTIGCSMIMPAVLAEMVNGVMNGSAFNDDDDDHEYAKTILWSIPKMYAGAIPGIGKGLNYGIEKMQGKNYVSSGFLSNPTSGLVENTINLIANRFRGNPVKPNEVKAAVTILAVLTGCPMLAWGGRTLSYEYGRQAGYFMPESAYDLIRGEVTGIASPQSKTN